MKKETSENLQMIVLGLILGFFIGSLFFSWLIDIFGIDQEKYCSNMEEREIMYSDVESYCAGNRGMCYSLMNCQNIHDKRYLCNGKMIWEK